MSAKVFNLDHLVREQVEKYTRNDDDFMSGLSIATLTPVDDEGNVDEINFKEHNNNLIKYANVKSLVIGGMNGEGSFLSEKNFKQLVKYSADLKSKWSSGSPIYVVGSIFRETIEDAGGSIGIVNLARLYAQNDDIDAILLAPPLNTKEMSKEEIIDLYKLVQEITEKPIIVYLTGQSDLTEQMDMDFLLELKEELKDNFVGVKNTQDGTDFIDAYEKKTREKGEYLGFRLLQGNDRYINYAFEKLIGLRDNQMKSLYPDAIGTCSGASNVYPIGQMTASMYVAKNEERDTFSEKIQNYINNEIFNQVLAGNEGFIGLQNHGPKAEPLIWKGMVKKYIPDMPLWIQYKGVHGLQDNQLHMLKHKTEAIENKKDKFALELYAHQNTGADSGK